MQENKTIQIVDDDEDQDVLGANIVEYDTVLEDEFEHQKPPAHREESTITRQKNAVAQKKGDGLDGFLKMSSLSKPPPLFLAPYPPPNYKVLALILLYLNRFLNQLKLRYIMY